MIITINSYDDFKQLPLRKKAVVFFALCIVPLALAGIIIAIAVAVGVVALVIPVVLIAVAVAVILAVIGVVTGLSFYLMRKLTRRG